ncbi:MAG: hypothetical protein IJ371_00775 [Clostridia bacterium]|nr:hypothetical protein [Clostridia bacterium]
MEDNKILVMLRPKTGMDYGKMYCKFFEDYFTLEYKNKGLFNTSNQVYKVNYSEIKEIEDSDYGVFFSVPGIRLHFTREDINFPVSPSKNFGGLIGAFISMSNAKKKKYIIYFKNQEDKNLFVEKCKIK